MLELMDLNDRQRAAAENLDGHILLTAPAGTGKTDTLAYRIANILESGRAEPEEVLCLTFTNKACQEMRERIERRAGEPGSRVYVKTFHSFCYDVIKSEAKRHLDLFADFVIFDEVDCRTLLREIMPEDLDVPAETLARVIAFTKEKQAQWDIMSGDAQADRRAVIARIYRAARDELARLCVDDRYQQLPKLRDGWEIWGASLLGRYDARLAEAHGLDFTDLIVRAKALLRQLEIARRWAARFRYINIDEVQDTSLLEYGVLERIFGESRLLLAGDPFQTIYEWRGSHPERVREQFVAAYQPQEIVLTENYRSTQRLLTASACALERLFPARVAALYPDGLRAESQELGERIEIKGAADFNEEAQWIYYRILSLPVENYARVAILTRSNRYTKELSAQFRTISRYAEGEPLPFLLIDDTRFFRRQEIKDALAFLKLAVNRHDTVSLLRVLGRFARGIGPAAIRTISSEAYRRAGVRITDYLDALTRETGDPFARLVEARAAENVVVFDVEATGVDTTRDEIIQIAGVRLAADGSIKGKFMHYIRPERSVGKSVRVHGLTDEFLRENGEPAAEVLRAFCTFAAGSVIVGHNVTYDLHILASHLARLGLPPLAYPVYFDTLDIFRRFHPNLPNHRLEYLGQVCEVTHASSHDAFDDICATAEILLYAMEHDIRPTAAARRICMEKYLDVFAPLAEKLALLRAQATELRPWQTLGQIVLETGMADYYKKRHEENRIENLRDLFRRAKELDDKELPPVDAVYQFLRYTTLSTTDLDALTKKKKIPIITIHQAKGAEFDDVFLAGLQQGTFPGLPALKKKDTSEEKRLFYVAITRAKQQLFLSWCQFRYGHYQQESEFIRALPSDCVRRV